MIDSFEAKEEVEFNRFLCLFEEFFLYEILIKFKQKINDLKKFRTKLKLMTKHNIK